MGMKRSRPTYIAQTQPGFETIAADETARRLEGAIVRETRVIADKNGMALFEYAGDVRDLFMLRTVEDVFVLIAALPDLPPTRAGLALLETAATRATTIDGGLALVRQIQPGRGGR